MTGVGKREWAARLLAATGVGEAWRRLAPVGNRITILAYHRVYDLGEEDGFPFDPELVSATPADFRWQMQHVLRAGSPMTFARLAAVLDARADLPTHPIIVTFDDGHGDNFTRAFPVLRDLGIPATVFLSTGYVGKAGTFWFDRVVQLLYRAPRGKVCVPTVALDEQIGPDVASRRETAGRLLRVLKAVPDAVRLCALRELEDALGGYPPPGDAALSGALTWDQVREMARAGIEFGSHSVTHPVLTRLDDGSLADELALSRRTIEKEVGQAVTAVAYPVGGPEAFDERVVSASVRAGYRFGVSYVSGVNDGVPDPYRLRRLHVERYTSRAYFEALLSVPGLFA